MRKKLFTQFKMFVFLLIAVELGMRLFGIKAGVSDSKLYPVDTLISNQMFMGDPEGVTAYIKDSPFLPQDHEINNQGFRSSMDFTPEAMDSAKAIKHSKAIFLVGDSYTEGCCATPIDSSFADLMMEKGGYVPLNFGVGATDLMQYKLVVNKYLDILTPDLVVIGFYLGNDIQKFARPVTPNVPVCYPIQDYNWLNSVGPPYFMEDYPKAFFESQEEAYDFYLSRYTLWHDETNLLEKILRHSIIFSRIYLWSKEKNALSDWEKKMERDEVAITNQTLREIKGKCHSKSVKMLVFGIPSPIDVAAEEDLEKKYGAYFRGLDYRFPSISSFSSSDYDGNQTGSHFNNSGHRRFYEFMKKELDAYFGQQPASEEN